jgi:hypothetical protein
MIVIGCVPNIGSKDNARKGSSITSTSTILEFSFGPSFPKVNQKSVRQYGAQHRPSPREDAVILYWETGCEEDDSEETYT